VIDTGIITLAFAPGAYWLWYFYSKDKWEKEPKRLVFKTFLLGLFIAAPVSYLVETLLDQPGRINSVVIAPIIEELSKLLIVRYTIFRNAEFNEPMDGITYAAAAALGFASIENAEYLLVEHHLQTGPGVYTLFLIRGFLSVPAHVLFSAMWGYGLGWEKFAKTHGTKPGVKHSPRVTILGGYWLAVGCHAMFNFSANALGLIALIIVSWVLWRMVRKRIDAALLGSPYVPRHLRKEE
jgi:RsiW-degrading membrane proteinase PrsW (M82 family)